MIITQAPLDVMVSGVEEQISYGIDTQDLGIIFGILRDKVYKNKPGAVCREIASNSRDAHTEAGRSDRPIQIEIQERLNSIFKKTELCIIFRDFGVGLSPDRVKNVYAKYGASTKRNDNEQTGGYGLGAKTPFAYTDMFTLRTIVDNVEYVYSNYIDESNEGRIALLSKTPIEMEGNMTEVIVPLKVYDRNTFENETIKNTYFWKVRPELINFCMEYPNLNLATINGIQIDTPKFTAYKSNYTFIESSINVIVDGIYYPVDTRMIDVADLSDVGFCYRFDNGVLRLAANRETLEYNDTTVAKLKQAINESVEIVRKKYEESFDNLSYYQAKEHFDNMWNGEPIFRWTAALKPYVFTHADGEEEELNCTNVEKFLCHDLYVVKRDSSYSDNRYVKASTNTHNDEFLKNADVYYVPYEAWKVKNGRLSTAINDTIVEASGRNTIYLLVQNEQQNNNTTAELYEAMQKDELAKHVSFGLNIVDNYYDVVPNKKKVKRTEKVKIEYVQGTCRLNTELEAIDGVLHDKLGNPISPDDWYFIPVDGVGEYAGTGSRLSNLNSKIPGMALGKKIAMLTKLKMKYFKEFISFKQLVLEKQDLIGKAIMKTKAMDSGGLVNVVYNLFPHSNVGQIAKEFMDAKIDKNVNYLYFDSLSFLQEFIPNFMNEINSRIVAMRVEVLNNYPLLTRLMEDLDAAKQYVDLVDELNRYKAMNAENEIKIAS